jgi:hypothetical protein
MITDEGWRLTEDDRDEGHVIVASREGEERVFVPKRLPATFYDRFADAIANGENLPRDVTDMRMAYEDVKLLRDAEKHTGVRTAVDLSLS